MRNLSSPQSSQWRFAAEVGLYLLAAAVFVLSWVSWQQTSGGLCQAGVVAAYASVFAVREGLNRSREVRAEDGWIVARRAWVVSAITAGLLCGAVAVLQHLPVDFNTVCGLLAVQSLLYLACRTVPEEIAVAEPTSLEEYVQRGSMSAEMAQLLRVAVAQRANIIIADAPLRRAAWNLLAAAGRFWPLGCLRTQCGIRSGKTQLLMTLMEMAPEEDTLVGLCFSTEQRLTAEEARHWDKTDRGRVLAVSNIVEYSPDLLRFQLGIIPSPCDYVDNALICTPRRFYVDSCTMSVLMQLAGTARRGRAGIMATYDGVLGWARPVTDGFDLEVYVHRTRRNEFRVTRMRARLLTGKTATLYDRRFRRRKPDLRLTPRLYAVDRVQSDAFWKELVNGWELPSLGTVGPA